MKILIQFPQEVERDRSLMQISMRPQNQSLISHCHGRNIIYYSSIATTFCLIGLTMIMICQQEKLIFASFLPTYLELILSTTTLK